MNRFARDRFFVRNSPNENKTILSKVELKSLWMTKIVIDKDTFKALASDTRLKILKALDGRKKNLSEIARETGLSKTTVLEHMNKLIEADLVRKIEREGHKWTYYKLSWKGSSLLHPDNVKIIITLCSSIFLLLAGIASLIIYGNGFYINASPSTVYMEGDAPKETLPYTQENKTFGNFSATSLESSIEDIARKHTLLGLPPKNVHIIYAPTDENITLLCGNTKNASLAEEENPWKITIFYQDLSYLYIGTLLVASSIVLLIPALAMLWRRKGITDQL